MRSLLCVLLILTLTPVACDSDPTALELEEGAAIVVRGDDGYQPLGSAEVRLSRQSRPGPLPTPPS